MRIVYTYSEAPFGWNQHFGLKDLKWKKLWTHKQLKRHTINNIVKVSTHFGWNIDRHGSFAEDNFPLGRPWSIDTQHSWFICKNKKRNVVILLTYMYLYTVQCAMQPTYQYVNLWFLWNAASRHFFWFDRTCFCIILADFQFFPLGISFDPFHPLHNGFLRIDTLHAACIIQKSVLHLAFTSRTREVHMLIRSHEFVWGLSWETITVELMLMMLPAKDSDKSVASR